MTGGVPFSTSEICNDDEGYCRTWRIWNLVEQSDNPDALDIAIEEGCNCPSGRLVIKDNESGKMIEAEFEKSIVIIEYPLRMSTAHYGFAAVSRSNPLMANHTKFGTVSPYVDAEDQRTNRFVTAAIFKDKNEQDG